MKSKSLIKYIIGFLIVAGAGYFFVREFYNNLDSISKFEFKINWFYLFTSELLLILVTLAGTYFWQLLLKIITSQQIKGISKTIVLYANLFLAVTSLFASAFWGLLYFACFNPAHTKFWLLMLFVFLLFYFGFIFLNQQCLKLLVKIVQKLFKKTITYTHIDVRWIIIFQLVYLLANAIFGITGYLLALGLGFSVSAKDIFAVAGSLIIADLIGFIVLIAPGGLGVREGIMFALLEALGDKSLALILPIGTRIMGMISDLLLGGVGFIFLKKTYSSKDNQKNNEKLV